MAKRVSNSGLSYAERRMRNKTSRSSKSKSHPWIKLVKRVYKVNKKDYSYTDAMQWASKLKKKHGGLTGIKDSDLKID